MEIVLGILLLFGAFTLGTVSSDSTDHETDTTHMESDGDHTSGTDRCWQFSAEVPAGRVESVTIGI